MKILATLDGSKLSEAILPVLQKMAALPNADIILYSVAEKPHSKVSQPGRAPTVGRASNAILVEGQDPQFAESKSQAIERTLNESREHLLDLARALPSGASVRAESEIAGDAADAIIDKARAENADVIVMATRGETGVRRALFGSTTEKVMRSGAAPVLLVHPQD